MPNSMSESSSKNAPRICIIGAGVSGMCTAIQLQKQLGIHNYTIFDENKEVGGTWFVNTYPGCACDVPSHLYSFSFEPNPNWSESFSSQPEILEYFKSVAKKHKLSEKIKFNHQVKKLVWDETILKWKVLVFNKSKNSQAELIFDIVFSALGGLRVPKIPEEFDSFKGRKVHTAQWDRGVKLANKKVGIIGTGASAVQVIPVIADEVKSLIVYQRNPPWVVPRLQFEFPNWLQWAFGTIPGVQTTFRASLFWLYEFSFSVYKKDSRVGSWGESLGRWYMSKEVKHDEDMQKSLTPNYRLGCKRITPSDEYYAALTKPNVHLVTDKIKEVKDRSIITENGNEEQLDVLILATGYRVQDFFAPMEITAKGSVNLLTEWKANGPSAYYGICSSITPNNFFISGPNSAAGNTSLIFSVECQVNWCLKILAEMMKRNSSVFYVDENEEADYMKLLLEQLKDTVWDTCGNWYTDHRGVVTTLFPSSSLTLWNKLRTPDFSKFRFH